MQIHQRHIRPARRCSDKGNCVTWEVPGRASFLQGCGWVRGGLPCCGQVGGSLCVQIWASLGAQACVDGSCISALQCCVPQFYHKCSLLRIKHSFVLDYPPPRPSFKIPNTLEGTSHSHLSVEEFTGNFLLERRTQNNKKNLGHCRESAAPEGNRVSPESSGKRGKRRLVIFKTLPWLSVNQPCSQEGRHSGCAG